MKLKMRTIYLRYSYLDQRLIIRWETGWIFTPSFYGKYIRKKIG